MADWIAPVEAAYDLGSSLDVWFDRLLEAAQPALGGVPIGGYVFAGPAGATSIAAVGQRGVRPTYMKRYEGLLEHGTREALARAFGDGRRPLFSSLSEQLFARFPELAEQFAKTSGVTDALYFVAPSGTGSVLAFGAPLNARRSTTPAERRHWTRLAAHIGAGLRLRGALDTAAALGEGEAVFDADGKLVDATSPASSSRAREVLRDAVMRRERARSTRERTDPDVALTLWEGLVAGRWSLVDHFESDGKRFVVAHQNDPNLGDPRGLSRRERQVAAYLGMGRSQKEIAYLLGISAGAVSNTTRRAAEKLGLGGVAELASFFAPNGLRARLEQFEIGGEKLLVTSAPLLDASALELLTDAEREVALDLLRAATVSEIALRRDSSPLTVESQVKALYTKLGVGSRIELAARLGQAGSV